jgi:hypothetical protein
MQVDGQWSKTGRHCPEIAQWLRTAESAMYGSAKRHGQACRTFVDIPPIAPRGLASRLPTFMRVLDLQGIIALAPKLL